jgi:hypothetical protein
MGRKFRSAAFFFASHRIHDVIVFDPILSLKRIIMHALMHKYVQEILNESLRQASNVICK